MWISFLNAGKYEGGCSMEGDELSAEGEFLFLFSLCRERLENRVLETALIPAVVLTKIMRGENMIS